MSTRVIIIGGGFGGLEAAFSLKSFFKPSFDITLIDRSAFHSFIPSIHLIVSGKVTAEEIRIPLRPVLGTAGIRFVQDEVLSLDSQKREVVTGGSRLPYDYLILSTGAESNFFSIPGVEEYSYRFRTPEHAERIRTAVLDILGGSRPCRIVLAGAGTEGVEVIGELIDVIRSEGREEELKFGAVSITAIEGKKRLLPGFPAEAQNRVEDHLLRQGVKLVAGDPIAEVAKSSVILNSGEKHDASLLIWTGGIQPSSLVRGLEFSKDPWGWLKVNDRLHVPADERIYGIGDAVSIYTGDGPLALNRVAYHAEDQARVAAVNILRRLEGKKPVTYSPKIKPSLVSLGRNMGILATEDRVYSGPWVVLLKKTLERTHLMTYLSKPLSSILLSKIPGAGAYFRLRAKLPV